MMISVFIFINIILLGFTIYLFMSLEDSIRAVSDKLLVNMKKTGHYDFLYKRFYIVLILYCICIVILLSSFLFGVSLNNVLVNIIEGVSILTGLLLFSVNQKFQMILSLKEGSGLVDKMKEFKTKFKVGERVKFLGNGNQSSILYGGVVIKIEVYNYVESKNSISIQYDVCVDSRWHDGKKVPGSSSLWLQTNIDEAELFD